MASTLAPYELFKYDFRLQTFLDKYKNGDTFSLLSGARVTLVFDPIIYTKLKNKDRIFAATVTFRDAKSNIDKRYRLSQFKKTEEFGGLSSATGKVYERNQIGEINEQIGKIMDDTSREFVPIVFKNKVYRITHCEPIPEGSKADLAFTAPGGVESFWVSYKRGSSPRDINQWSGVAGLADHPEVASFIEKVSDLCSLNDNSIWPAVTFARKIEDADLMNFAVWGMAYNKTRLYSRNNVNMVLQGRIKLLPSGKFWKLSATKEIENSDPFKGEHSAYQPVLMAIHKGSDRNQFGIKNARFMIHPMMGRSVTQWI